MRLLNKSCIVGFSRMAQNLKSEINHPQAFNADKKPAHD
jgi:hypothetical protein